mmetsp:Transcript_5146/g.5599  ORF Transcript_5146/g.5599 Transcript_5146/m.5599 type:complete len:244 (+) Transcript_5146:83-814(+)
MIAAGNEGQFKIKVGIVGDSGVGKTSLLTKYVENQLHPVRPNFNLSCMEKTIRIRSVSITFAVWDIGGKKSREEMMPLVVQKAVAVIFLVDLSRPETIKNVRYWYRRVRSVEKTFFPVLVGNKWDLFMKLPLNRRIQMGNKIIKYSRAMKAPLVFSSCSMGINVKKIFKVILVRAFGLKSNLPSNTTDIDAPLVSHPKAPKNYLVYPVFSLKHLCVDYVRKNRRLFTFDTLPLELRELVSRAY